MDIFNVRFGLATNSSSKHSLIFLPESVNAEDHSGYPTDNSRDFGDFGWNFFTAASTQAKMRYLATLLKDRLYYELPKNIADAVIHSWLENVYYEEDDGIDHQSFMFIPSSHGTTLPDERFFNELKAYLLQDRLAILGGNDNERTTHYLADGDTFWLPVPSDTSVYWSNYVCRFDEQYKYWTIFCVKDGTKIRFRFDAPPNQMKVVPQKSSTPELIDLKITDFCPYECDFCTPSETQILTQNGSQSIENIKVGDIVYNYNEATSLRQEDIVEQVHVRDYDGELISIETENGSVVKLTPNHTVFTSNRGWIACEDIQEGDDVLDF